MQAYLRISALFLALVMCVTLLSACKSGDEVEDTTEKVTDRTESSETNSDPVESETEYKPDIAEKNYGEEFYLWIMPDVNPIDYYWVKEAGNNTLSDAIYVRQENVRKYLGVEVIGTATGNTTEYITPFKTAVKNKDDSVHMMVSHVFFGIDGFITENYLTDFNDIDEIDTYAPYWNQQFMDDLTINGHMYLGFSDFNILYTNVVVFNKEMLDMYDDHIDGTLYDMVTEYRWTLDRMISLANLVYTDTNSDGKTDDDIFGLTGFLNVPFAPFIQASNMSVVEMDESGNYTIAVYNQKNKHKMSDLVDKLYSFVRSDSAWLKKDSTSPVNIFSSGRSLMHLSTTYGLPKLLNYNIDFGVLPYPMYDETQKDVGYRHLQWGGYICIPSYLKDPRMACETVEMLSYFSENVNIAFYEKLLGKQVADSPLDRDMLSIVWNSVCSDFGQTYGSAMNSKTDFLFMLCNLVAEGSTYNLASYVASGESVANKGLKKFVAKVK